MSGFDLSITNIILLLSVMGPLIISSYLIILSVSNNDMKSIIFLAGLFVLIVLYIITIMSFGTTAESVEGGVVEGAKVTSALCNIVNLPGGVNNYANTTFNSAILSFIFAYLAVPMFFSTNS
jgi:hypothetical protein